MTENHDFNRTLEDLEGEVWGEADFKSSLVLKSHALRKKPINSLTNEDLRLLISQDLGLTYVISIAIERLSMNPFNSGDLFVGDLLATILKLNKKFLSDNPEIATEIDLIVKNAKEIIKEMETRLENHNTTQEY
ncbi:contact-dependent growth inhibition system immunity protein [Paenibacillus sp. YIM B09110]|uniref:contact-dependent growth inhibition system immunity protein n=1 Tax=Paenibacillus sp. YIM B09110 TaxID=3126102 RepID=UPI00301CF870